MPANYGSSPKSFYRRQASKVSWVGEISPVMILLWPGVQVFLVGRVTIVTSTQNNFQVILQFWRHLASIPDCALINRMENVIVVTPWVIFCPLMVCSSFASRSMSARSYTSLKAGFLFGTASIFHDTFCSICSLQSSFVWPWRNWPSTLVWSKMQLLEVG